MNKDVLQIIWHLAENRTKKAREVALEYCKKNNEGRDKVYVNRYIDLLEGSVKTSQLPPALYGMLERIDISDEDVEKRYYLPVGERPILERIKKMSNAATLLREKHIPFLNATLLCGESGTGKTAFAKYMANCLGKPFYYINFSRLISSNLGQTSKNIYDVFRYVSEQDCVLMLDEIDCISIERRNASSGQGVDGEMARIVITLMQCLDTARNDMTIIAATNRMDMMDSALLNRFHTVHEVKRLSHSERVAMVTKYLDAVDVPYDLENVQEYCKSHSIVQREIMQTVNEAIADMLLENKTTVKLP